jgi:hypothetical protein
MQLPGTPSWISWTPTSQPHTTVGYCVVVERPDPDATQTAISTGELDADLARARLEQRDHVAERAVRQVVEQEVRAQRAVQQEDADLARGDGRRQQSGGGARRKRCEASEQSRRVVSTLDCADAVGVRRASDSKRLPRLSTTPAVAARPIPRAHRPNLLRARAPRGEEDRWIPTDVKPRCDRPLFRARRAERRAGGWIPTDGMWCDVMIVTDLLPQPRLEVVEHGRFVERRLLLEELLEVLVHL